mmetsp:Transcript_28914/g.25575  ORF Transcript_28914/g.25575 Transcript_28914/m.25575 type:complete len:362 (+) Transcript_28914:11-1096(+)
MKSSSDQEKRLKRNEERDPANDKLDWFNFETRIRKLIHELMEPTVVTGVKAQESITRFHTRSQNIEERLEKLETELWQTEKQNTAYHTIDQRINDHDALIEQLESRIQQEVGNLIKSDKEIKDSVKIVSFEMEEVLRKSDKIKEEIGQTNNNLINHVKEIKKSFNTQIEDLEEEIQSIKFNISNLQESVKSINSSSAQCRENLSSHDIALEQNYNKTLDALLKIEDLSLKVCLKDVYEKEIIVLKEESRKCLYSIQDVGANVEETDLYINKYLPVKTQEMINAAFKYFSISDLEKEKVLDYEVKRYKELHQIIINELEGDFNKKTPQFPSLTELEASLKQLKKRNHLINAYSANEAKQDSK